MTEAIAVSVLWIGGGILVCRFLVGKIDYWQKRAEAADQMNAALRKLVFDKTGVNAEIWWLVDAGKVYIENPRSNIKITGLQMGPDGK